MDGEFFAGGHWGIGLMGRKRGREVCCGSYTLRDPQMLPSGSSIYIIWLGNPLLQHGFWFALLWL